VSLFNYLLVPLFLFLGCSSNGQINLTSDHQILSLSKTGILLSVNLDTNDRIKRGNNCYLIFNNGKKKYSLKLAEGKDHYALDLSMGSYQIDELNCGTFYYFKVDKEAAPFYVSPGKISYIGQLDFELHDHGKLIWGHTHTNRKKLEENILSMGFAPNDVELSLLRF